MLPLVFFFTIISAAARREIPVSAEVYCQEPVPLGFLVVEYRASPDETGVVHEDIEPSELLHAKSDRLLRLGVVCDVGGELHDLSGAGTREQPLSETLVDCHDASA